MESIIVMCGVNEYVEGMEVSLRPTAGIYEPRVLIDQWKHHGREVIYAKNEGGYNCTEVDLNQLLEWVAQNRPAQYARFIT